MIVQLPNGKTAEFPDSMSPQEVESVLAKEFTPQAQPAQPPRDAVEMTTPHAEQLASLGMGGAEINQWLGDSTKMTLPKEAGRFAGSLVGGIAGAKLPVPGWMKLGTGALGAGLGAIGFDAAQKSIEGRPVSMADALKIGGEEAAYDLVGGVAMKGLTKALAPFAGKMGSKAKDLSRLIKENKLPISIDQYSPSQGVAKLFQRVADNTPAGRLWTQVKRNQLNKKLMRMYDDALEEIPNRQGAEVAGEKVGAAVKGARAANVEKYKGMYDRAKEIALAPPYKGVFRMENTAQYLKDAPPGATLDPAVKKARGWLRRKLKESDGLLTYEEVEEAVRGAWAGKDKASPLKGALKRALLSDLPADVRMFRQSADEAYAFAAKYKNNPTVKRIVQKHAKGETLNVLRGTFRMATEEEIEALRRTLPKDAFDMLGQGFLEDILERSAPFNDAGTARIFKPMVFAEQYNRYRDKLARFFSDDLTKRLDQFATISAASAEDIGRAQGFQKNMGMIGAGQAGISALAGASGADWGASIVVPNAFGLVVAKSLMNPKGWMRKWLTEGVKLGQVGQRVGQETIKAGEREGKKLIGSSGEW